MDGWHTDLHEVGDGEPVSSILACVTDPEVEPLGVFVGVQVIPQLQFILKLRPGKSEEEEFDKMRWE